MSLDPTVVQFGMAMAPDYNKQLAAQLGLQTERLQQQQITQQLAEAKEKQARAQSFQQDLTAALHAGGAQPISQLMMKYPEFTDKIKAGWDVKDKATRDADLTQLGEMYSAAAGGRWDLAQKAAQARLDADKAAGNADPMDQEIVDAIDKAAQGDTTAQKSVLGIIGVHLAAATGPEHFGTVYGQLRGSPHVLGPGAVLVDENGDTVAHSPLVQGADGSLYDYNSVLGGAPPSAKGGDTSAGGFDNAVGFVLKHEGGYNPSDRNGSPVNYGINAKANPGVDVKSLTPDQAKQIYLDKYWKPSGAENLPAAMQTPYFDTYVLNPKQAQKMLAASGDDPVKFLQLRQNWLKSLEGSGKYDKAWTQRTNDLMAMVGGQPVAQSGPRVLLPGKEKAAPAGFRWNGDKLEAIPGGPADPDEGIDDATATFYAQQMLTGGQMPTLGMGKAAAQARQKILSKVAQIAGAEGLTGKDLAVQVAHYKANLTNVQNLEKQAGTIEQNEQTALMNGQQFIDRSKELSAQTRFPIVNSVTQSYLRHTGDPTVAAMDSAWNTFVAEYAKVVSGSPSGAGVLSDSARHEAMDTMRGNYSLQQKEAAFKQMQADMANRMAAIKSQVAKGYQSLGSRAPGVGVNAGTSDLPKGAKVIGTYRGKRVIEVNGKRMVEQ